MIRRRPAGFTLLEAIVALVIFSMGALALYAWLASNQRTLARVQEQRQATAVVYSAIDALRGLNPMATPKGRREIGSLLVEWSARPVEPPRAAVMQTGLPTIFKVGLYTLDVTVSQNGEEVDRFQMRQLGYQQVGTLEDE